MQNPDENQSSGTENDPKRFVDKHTDERIQQHLTNEEDTISAEDIKNVQSDIHSPQPISNVTDDEDVIISEDIKTQDEEKEDIEKPRDITPWNVID